MAAGIDMVTTRRLGQPLPVCVRRVDLIDNQQVPEQSRRAHVRVIDRQRRQESLVDGADDHRADQESLGMLRRPAPVAQPLGLVVIPQHFETGKPATGVIVDADAERVTITNSRRVPRSLMPRQLLAPVVRDRPAPS